MAREPINLILLKGNRAKKSKAEIAERKATEVKAPNDKVRAPGYLPKDLKPEFNKIAKALVDLELMSNLDVDALARFLLAREQYIRTSALLRETDPVEENYMYGKLLSNVDTLSKQCRNAAADLGLTISSRCKLLVPKPKNQEPTPEEQRFGNV